jgi:hypothetical protein
VPRGGWATAPCAVAEHGSALPWAPTATWAAIVYGGFCRSAAFSWAVHLITLETYFRDSGYPPMKLGSLKEGGRDGTLIVVSRDLRHGVRATGIATTLQQALEDWSHLAPRLNALYESLNDGSADGVFDIDLQALAAPLPRA